jgi:hypothetical protein
MALKNAYRVLLTRARQGMVVIVPRGDDEDPTVAASTSMEGVPVTVEEVHHILPATVLLRRAKRTPRSSVGTAMR